MATLGMQTEQEVATLKKTIAMGGTVSRELLDTFDDILPITQRFADSAATQSALIVQQMRNAEITVDQAKARILALNAQIEAEMGSAVGAYAASRGRVLDLTKAPMMNQPVLLVHFFLWISYDFLISTALTGVGFISFIRAWVVRELMALPIYLYAMAGK